MPLPITLAEWLAHCERLHPRTIDLTLSRMQVLRERLGLSFEAPLVVVAGFVPAALAYQATTQGKSAASSAFVGLAVPAIVLVGAHSYLRSRKTVHS